MRCTALRRRKGRRDQQHAHERLQPSRTIEIEGHPAPDPNNLPSVDFRVQTHEYFSVMRIPILRGRDFTDADREDTAPVVIISRIDGAEVLAE